MLNSFKQRQAARTHQAIKQYYLSKGRTEQQWQTVNQHPGKFNQVWRSMLRLPLNDQPPPKSHRT